MRHRKKKELTDEPYGFDLSIIFPEPATAVIQPTQSLSRRTAEATTPKVVAPPKTFSIKKAMAISEPESDSKPPAEKDQTTDVDDNNEGTDELSLEEVSLLIAEYANEKLADKPMYAGLLVSDNMQLDDSGQIVIGFESQLQHDLFQDFRIELSQFLGQRLNRRLLNVVGVVLTPPADGEKSRIKPYTAEDRFKYLAEKSPELLKFKQRFNLDL